MSAVAATIGVGAASPEARAVSRGRMTSRAADSTAAVSKAAASAGPAATARGGDRPSRRSSSRDDGVDPDERRRQRLQDDLQAAREQLEELLGVGDRPGGAWAAWGAAWGAAWASRAT